jgi:hypothetical protein
MENMMAQFSGKTNVPNALDNLPVIPPSVMREVDAIAAGLAQGNEATREGRIGASIDHDERVGIESTSLDPVGQIRHFPHERLDPAAADSVRSAALALAQDPGYLGMENAAHGLSNLRDNFENQLVNKYKGAPNAPSTSPNSPESATRERVGGRSINVDPSEKMMLDSLRDNAGTAAIAHQKYIGTKALEMGVASDNTMYVARAMNLSYQEPAAAQAQQQERGAPATGVRR